MYVVYADGGPIFHVILYENPLLWSTSTTIVCENMDHVSKIPQLFSFSIHIEVVQFFEAVRLEIPGKQGNM